MERQTVPFQTHNKGRITSETPPSPYALLPPHPPHPPVSPSQPALCIKVTERILLLRGATFQAASSSDRLNRSSCGCSTLNAAVHLLHCHLAAHRLPENTLVAILSAADVRAQFFFFFLSPHPRRQFCRCDSTGWASPVLVAGFDIFFLCSISRYIF